jgi:hypothetical protein
LRGRSSTSRQTDFVPWQAPCQRANRQPSEGVAVSFTGPGTNAWLHRPPQLIPDGRLLMVPRPNLCTVNVASFLLNAAVTDVSPFTATEQVATVPVHAPPDQPVKIDPGSGVAIRVNVPP